MSKFPYPGLSPTYAEANVVGGYNRNCFVIEFLSLGELGNTRTAAIQEQLEAAAERLVKQFKAIIQSSQVVTPDRFDPILKSGLRLTK